MSRAFGAAKRLTNSSALASRHWRGALGGVCTHRAKQVFCHTALCNDQGRARFRAQHALFREGSLRRPARPRTRVTALEQRRWGCLSRALSRARALSLSRARSRARSRSVGGSMGMLLSSQSAIAGCTITLSVGQREARALLALTRHTHGMHLVHPPPAARN